MMGDAAPASESTPTGVRVLVVDDDVVICRQMAANLSSAGYQVVTAHDGARALAQAEATPPDLAIVDLEMPGTHGLDVIRTLKGMFGPAVHLSVTNSGPLIADDVRSQLFVKYVRGTGGKRGMGLYFAGWWPKPMAAGSMMKPPRSGLGSSCSCPAAREAVVAIAGRRVR